MAYLKEIENITKVAEKVYPFAYALFPDELLAHQLAMDGLSGVLLNLVDELEVEEEQKWPQNLNWQEVCLQIFRLAQRRSHHARTLSTPEENFFKLGLELRAALFLNYRYHLPKSEAARILEMETSDFLGLLHRGKNKLLSHSAQELPASAKAI